MDVLWQGGLYVGNVLEDALGEVDGADTGLLCHCNDHSGLALDGADTQARLFPGNGHGCDIGHGHYAVVVAADHSQGQVLHLAGVNLALDYVLVAVVVYHAAGSILIHSLCGLEHFFHGDTELLHTLGRELYLVLAHVATEHRHLAYAAQCQQARSNGAVGDGAQVEHAGRVGCEADYHYLAEDGRLRTHGGLLYARRQFVGHS